jgi:septal ring factor EnvC (AmiA/AmiB activator)
MAEALRKAIETFAAAPQSPASAAPMPGDTQRENIVRSVKRFEESVTQWRADMLTVQQGLAQMYESLSELSDRTAFNDQLSKLDEFIEDVDKEIESERLALEQNKFLDRQVIAAMMKSSSDNAHFMKKIIKRLYEAGVAQHNARVDFYHFLLGQRAKHNPDYSGGPTFENAEDLIADLHKHGR